MPSASVNTSSAVSSAPIAKTDYEGDIDMAGEDGLDERILNNLDDEVTSINMDNETTVVHSFPRYVPVDISSIPTLLPEPIAAIITGLAGTSRVSFRLLAFFTEAILETSQFSTRMYMGYSRRFFITMISSARRFYIASEKLRQGNLIGAAGFTDEPLGPSQGFLGTLDRYTNLGIYIIHHGHTLAELFAMSGFFIGSAAAAGSAATAQLTVGLFDDLFGSNESSRMLSAMISMISKEVLDDERFKAKNLGATRIFAGLTRALTAFVCLQYKTWRVTSARLKMRLIYDCSVVHEKAGTSGSIKSLAAPTRTQSQPSSSSSITSGNEASPMQARPVEVVDRQIQLADRIVDKQLRQPGSVYEITDEYRESIVTTQTLEQVRTTDRRPLLETADESASAETDWIEVDQLLGDKTSQLPSSPNGGSDSPTARRNVTDYHSTERIQLVLRTMTDKLKQRTTTVRRMPANETETAPSSTSQSVLLDEGPAEEGTLSRSRNTTTPHLGPSPMPLASSAITRTSSRSSSAPKNKRRSYPGPPAGQKKISPVKAAMSKARTVFRPMMTKRGRRASRSPGPTQDDDCIPTHSRAEAFRTPPTSPKPNIRAPPPTPADTLRVLRAQSLSSSPAINSRPREEQYKQSVQQPSLPTPITHQSSERESNTSLYQETATRSTSDTADNFTGRLFPADTLTNNIHRFMRFSSAAYGQYFLRILGIGDSDCFFPSTDKYHGNTWAFAQHTNLEIENILLSSYTDSSPIFGDQKAPPIVHYIAVDHAMKAVVLTCRGTLGISDVLIDLTCDYCSIDLESDDPEVEYFAHSGMYHAAMRMTARSSLVHETLIRALNDNPTYGLVITGHSLGGGVSALITLAWAMPSDTFLNQKSGQNKPIDHPEIFTSFVTSIASGLPPGRPIHCYTYGVPAISSPDLATYSKGLITSVVHDNDVVPTLSLGILRDLKNVALTLSEEGWTAESIVTRVLGVNPFKFGSSMDFSTLNPFEYIRRMAATDAIRPQSLATNANHSQEQLITDWMVSLIKTMRADMDNDKLYPPGDVYIVESEETFVTVDTEVSGDKRDKKLVYKQGHRVKLFKCESVFDRFREPRFAKNMMTNHTPMSYERATQLLVKGMAGKV